ncbi:MAG: hypothetical protein KF729_00130 [Sandaracinaceae bacterium]|nr:hypothetical protein [Sandaracinaceae bacterium]
MRLRWLGFLVGVGLLGCGSSGSDESSGATRGEEPAGAGGGGPSVTPIQVAATATHACAVMSDGTIQCWGQNGFGQLGNGGTTASPTAGVPVAGIRDAVEVDVAFGVSCARTRGGQIYCWGRAASGLLGSAQDVDVRTPILVPGIDDAVDLDLARMRAAAVTRDGTVLGWGQNVLGGFGWPDWVTGAAQPMAVARVENAAEVAVSTAGVTVRTSGGALQAVGLTPLCRIPARGVDALTTSIHGCFQGGGAWMCCGGNDRGQLGFTGEGPLTPMPFPRAGARVLIAQGSSTWSITAEGTAACTGDCTLAVIPPALGAVDELAPGETFHCARRERAVQCWGSQGEVPEVAAWTGHSPITFAPPGPPAPLPPTPPTTPIPGLRVVGVPRHTSFVDPASDAVEPPPDAPLQVGQVVAARFRGGGVFQARVTETLPDGRVSLRWESNERGTVNRSEIRIGGFTPMPSGRSRHDGAPLSETPVAAGTVVWVRDGRYWFRASVLSDEGGPVRVRFFGYFEPDRRTFPRSSVRLDA